MIQLWNSGTTAVNGSSNEIYVSIFDEYQDKDNIQYKPIITLTSHITGKAVTLLPSSYSYTNKERYVELKILNKTSGSQSLAVGKVLLGNTDFPYGFYDVTIREAINASLPTDPAVLNSRHVVYTGLANLVPTTTGSFANPAVTYTEYTTNDSDTESVYITN